MGLWARTGRLTKAALLVTAGAAGGGAAIAVASVPDSNGVIHACYSVDPNGHPVITNGANLTVFDPSAGQSCNPAGSAAVTERELDWNQTGPPGPPGQPGATGTPGAAGPPGNTVTLTKGGTLLLGGGQVLTVESSGGGANLPNPPSGGVEGDELVLGSGAGSQTFSIRSVVLLGSGITASGNGSGAGKTTVHDITVVRQADSSTPKLFEDCELGRAFKSATIILVKKGGQEYLRYTLSDVLCTAEQTGGVDNDGRPTEQVTLNFGSLQINYVSQGSGHSGVIKVKVKLHRP